MADFIPPKDADLLSFATNFSTKVTAAPTTYGLVVGDQTLDGKQYSIIAPPSGIAEANQVVLPQEGTVIAP